MNAREAEIEELSTTLNRLYCSGDVAGTKQVAEKLSQLLGEPTPQIIERFIHSWILLWEARGDLEEAIRLQDQDIARERAEIEAGDYNAYPKLLAEAAEYLQDSLYLQAERCHELGSDMRAINYLSEACTIAEKYGVEVDEDVRALLARLTSG